jgi:hypothetical protein
MLELHASKWRPCSSEGRGCWQQHLLTRHKGSVLHEDGSAEKDLSADLPVDDNVPSPRKRADFPRVFRHERASANRLRETSRDVGSRNACWCGSRSCARLEGLVDGPSAPGAYREGRCQSGRVPRGAFVKA